MTMGPHALWKATTFWLRVVGPSGEMKSWPKYFSTKSAAGQTASTKPSAVSTGTPIPPSTIPMNIST